MVVAIVAIDVMYFGCSGSIAMSAQLTEWRCPQLVRTDLVPPHTPVTGSRSAPLTALVFPLALVSGTPRTVANQDGATGIGTRAGDSHRTQATSNSGSRSAARSKAAMAINTCPHQNERWKPLIVSRSNRLLVTLPASLPRACGSACCCTPACDCWPPRPSQELSPWSTVPAWCRAAHHTCSTAWSVTTTAPHLPSSGAGPRVGRLSCPPSSYTSLTTAFNHDLTTWSVDIDAACLPRDRA